MGSYSPEELRAVPGGDKVPHRRFPSPLPGVTSANIHPQYAAGHYRDAQQAQECLYSPPLRCFSSSIVASRSASDSTTAPSHRSAGSRSRRSACTSTTPRPTHRRTAPAGCTSHAAGARPWRCTVCRHRRGCPPSTGRDCRTCTPHCPRTSRTRVRTAPCTSRRPRAAPAAAPRCGPQGRQRGIPREHIPASCPNHASIGRPARTSTEHRISS